MDSFDLIGPRSIPVREGLLGEVIEGRRMEIDTGHGKTLSPPIFDPSNVIGRTGPCPFDNTVKDFNGNVVGELTGPPTDRTLERW